jgi:DNA repair exonuclease SbcCD ATPase subunit
MNKTILLKSLALRNFKGFRDLKIEFSDIETVISGENATGKTTIMDAFLWLLFGKDSTGRADTNFNIKTLDSTGKPFLHLEHEVTGVFEVNGRVVTLQRTYLEKWEKPRGTTVETLKNHYTEYAINGVKQPTKLAYEMEVSDIIPEDVFRIITNPFYFTSMKPEQQKAILLEMAGNVSDDEVAALKPEYLELLSQLSGKSLDTFKKEIGARKKAIKDELAQIPARIDTALQLMPESEKWNELEGALSAKRGKVSEIENQIADKSKLVEEECKRKSDIHTKIGFLRMDITRIQDEIRDKVREENSKSHSSIQDLGYKIQDIDSRIGNKSSLVASIDAQIKEIDTTLETLRGQYRSISAEQLQFPEGAFECPTCHRPLDMDDIEAKQQELNANFNQNKSNRLQRNQEDGTKKSKEKNELQKTKESLLAEISGLENEKDTLQGQKQYQTEQLPEAKDADALIQDNPDWIRLGNEIADWENQLNVEAKPVDTSELQEKKRALNDEITELNKRLAKREMIENTQKVIDELEEKQASNNQALADLERIEFIALDFQKAKDNELMSRINGRFSLVSFSFIEEQLNGGEKITCVCTVNGIPYPDVNNAGKINAGLDIIGAIQRNKGIYAPVWIDNAESINEFIPLLSQMVLLRVTKDSQITIQGI